MIRVWSILSVTNCYPRLQIAIAI